MTVSPLFFRSPTLPSATPLKDDGLPMLCNIVYEHMARVLLFVNRFATKHQFTVAQDQIQTSQCGDGPHNHQKNSFLVGPSPRHALTQGLARIVK